MPKLVDHEERKKQIAEATCRMIVKSGMEGATVRNIAQEAGLSLGALRHYFSTQEELLIHAMMLVKERAEARIELITMQNLPPKEMILQILLEIIPTNDVTLAEMEVWFAFIAYTKSKPEMQLAQDDGIFSAMVLLFNMMESAGLLKSKLDKEIETERLYALVDGLALHAMLHPERMNKEMITNVLLQHLDEILT